MSQKNVNKFLAGAVTATMVATAVVTPAMAASFTDTGKLPEQIKGEVDRAVELGYFQDSEKFNPAASITRGQVALVIARQVSGVAANDIAGLKAYVAKHGLEEKVTPFADVKKGETELYYASLIVKDAGAFTQDSLNPASNITRSQMAKVVVTAFDLKMNEDNKKEITDIDKVSNKEYIEILASNGVTEPQNGKFNPGNNVTRSQMASFLVRAHDGVKEEVKEAKVESVSAINAKQVEVKFSKEVGTGAETVGNYDVKTVVGTTQNVVTDAELQSDGKTVILTLTDAYKVATDIIVSVDGVYLKGSIKEQFPKFSTVINVNDTVAPTITSVSSKTNTNAAQNVTVQFSEPISNTPVFKVNGSLATATKVGNGDVFVLNGLNLSVDKVHELEVLNFEDYAEHNVTYVKQNFSVTKDNTTAQGKAVMVSDNKVEVTFDKVITKASLINVDILRYDETSKSYVPVTLVVSNPFDLDKTGKVATFYIDDTEKANFFGLNDTTEDLIVKVKSGVLDSAGNQVKPFEQAVKATEDVAGPAFESVTYKKDSKGAVTELFFQFNEGLTFEGTGSTALVANDIKVTDLSTNNEVAFADVFGTNNTVEVAADGKTLIVKPDATASTTVKNQLKSGKYSFEVRKGLVKDTSFGKNDNRAAAKTVDFGAVANEVTVSKTTINEVSAVNNELTVDFSKAVTAASAINPANYSINGKALPSDTVITVVSATQVKFTLPANTVAKSDGAAVLTVTNIKAQDSSATFKTFVGTINALDNTAPVATATVLKNGLVQLTFSEAVTVDSTDFEMLKINGKELSTASTTASITLADGTPAVTVSVVAATATDFNSTGFTYQYIDVDGDEALDFTKDIVLKSVKATTAPADWTTVADLNLTDTVEILLPTSPKTADKSTLNNAQTGGTAGNKLKSGVVKAK